jgi:hypothetical protein
MTKNLSYYRKLPYRREWLPRDDESGRYFVLRLEAIPEVYSIGRTKREATAKFFAAFDDQIEWMIEEGLEIAEPMVEATGDTVVQHLRIVEWSPPAEGHNVIAAEEPESRSRGAETAYVSARADSPELEAVAL